MRLLHLKVVLAAVDVGEDALTVLRGAHALAESAGASLHALHVSTDRRVANGGPDGSHSTPTEMMRRKIDDAGIPADAVTVHVLNGEPAGTIGSIADEFRADVIVLGRHRGAMTTDTVGSTALRTVTDASVPCLILSERMPLPLTCVLVPVDLSDTSRGALVVALSWASALRAAKDTVSLPALVVETARSARGGDSAVKQALDEELNRLRRDAGTWANVDVSGVVVSSDDVVAAIAASIREMNADLVVLGTRGLGLDGAARLGSVSLGVAQSTTAAILLVPPAVWRNQ